MECWLLAAKELRRRAPILRDAAQNLRGAERAPTGPTTYDGRKRVLDSAAVMARIMLPTGMDIVPQGAEPLRPRACVAEERVIVAGETLLKATLNVPLAAHAVVALLHATSGGRFGVERRFNGEVFEQAGFATLQVDLLTPAEEAELWSSRHPENYVSLLLSRVIAVVDWLGNQRDTVGLSLGLFASSMATIPALMAAERTNRVAAVVSQGGCPDFAPDAVGELRAPTLLIVGRDEQARAAELASEFFARRLTSLPEHRRA